MNENDTNQGSANLPNILFQSLRLAQEEITNPKKDTKGHNYQYAQLDQVLAIIKPILSRHGLGIMQTPSGKIEEGCLTLKTVIFHESGQHLVEQFQIPIPQGRNITQDFGACLSYARRYSILSLFSLAQEDNDGQGTQPIAPTNKPSSNAKKKAPTNAHAKLMEDADKRIGNLEIVDWAEGVNFIPHKSSEDKLKKFMSLTDEQLKAKVIEWDAKQKEVA
jgi:hypothetical protein